MRRVMWIEDKQGQLSGPARIGWVELKNGGKKLLYKDKVFVSLSGRGFKTNFRDRESGGEYWISGCRRDGMDALYNTDVEIDEDALEEYWLRIRKRPEHLATRRLRARGKH